MTDTRTVWIPITGRGDWQLLGRQLLVGDDLETAVLISLFTDRLANEDDVIPDGGDARGWWGDLGQAAPIGSRLWLLERRTLTPQTALDAADFAREALQWLLDDKVVASIDIATEIQHPGRLAMRVDLSQQDGTKLSLAYSWAWGQLA